MTKHQHFDHFVNNYEKFGGENNPQKTNKKKTTKKERKLKKKTTQQKPQINNIENPTKI